MFRRSLAFLLLLLPATGALGQVVAAARGGYGGDRLEVGAGYSNFQPDFGLHRDNGISVWGDYRVWRFIKVEVEYRTLFDTHSEQLKEHTFAGGAVGQYRWHKWEPYGKFLFGKAHIDFSPLYSAPPTYRSDDYSAYMLGGGVQYRLTHKLRARFDYEYQHWNSDLAGSKNSLTPNGLTIGASYSIF
jgi:opacity protein-like surface antigen